MPEAGKNYSTLPLAMQIRIGVYTSLNPRVTLFYDAFQTQRGGPMNSRRSRTLTFLLLTFIFSSCKKAPQPDGVCTYDPLPAGADVPSGQGGALTTGTTDAYFYAFDTTGKQIGAQVSNRLLALKPADYRLKVNNSTHLISVPAKMLAKCSTGTVQAAGKTDEYYYIFDGAGTQLAAAKLGTALSLFPGKFQARLNNTPAGVDITPNAVAELKPGTLNVQGTTDEYYYVFNAMGTQLASSKLGRAVALLEGPYTAKVNNAGFPVKVDPGRTNEFQTGALTVKGSGSDYYYVFDTNGVQLGSNKLNQPLSLPAGTYSVKVGNNTRTAAVTAGQSAVVNW